LQKAGLGGINKMNDRLKKAYFTFLLPSILGFAAACLAKTYDFFEIGSVHFIQMAGPLIFILCIALAIAFPIFYRTLFAHKNRDLISVSDEKLLKFERTLINVVMMTPYLALVAYFFELPRFYTTSAILIGLYAVYYFYPSKTRIAFEKRIFRVK
jgi:Ca2+/Na+ antiporter